MILLAAWACTPDPKARPDDSAPTGPREVPWARELPPAGAGPRGLLEHRAIVHLHSPWSHDACDGDGLPDGVVNEPCLQDLRAGLCAGRIDVAFLTDHPAYAAFQSFDDLFHHREGDTWVDAGGEHVANELHCDDGHVVRWLPGIEDELMPIGLEAQVAGDDFDENDRIYNTYDASAVRAEREVGATVLVAHTEQRPAADLEPLQDAGLAGVEIFNLHAAFDPDIRGEYLGLDPLGWAEGIAPFTSPDATGEPDLYFLGVFEEQAVSLATWEALLARGPMTAVAGTDAHQNVLPLLLRDGERGDSYRRMLRWFSNRVRTTEDTPTAVEAALAAGQTYVAIEALATPTGFDLYLQTPGGVVEMGGEGGAGELVVTCPTLHPDTPRGLEAPEITATVYRNGAEWQQGCGTFPTDGPGTYRVRIEIVPHHLVPFLGEDPAPYLRRFPWIWSNAIRVE
jgi:hypothetical protein